jgi:Flp pilus assembly protein TadB
MPWHAIQYVSSSLTLIAFAIAAVLWAYRLKIKEQRRRIETAAEEDRAALVSKTLEFFDVDTANLTKEQRYNVAILQIKARGDRYLQGLLALIFFGVLCLAAFAVSKMSRVTVQPTSQTIIQKTGDATTNGPNSPANTGNVGSTTVNGSSQSPPPKVTDSQEKKKEK